MRRWYARSACDVTATGPPPGSDRVPFAIVQRVEFTVEPFIEGSPGRHVTEPLEAVKALGIEVEFGPFGSGCVTSTAQAGDVVAAIVRAALENGATHVNIDVASMESTGKAE